MAEPELREGRARVTEKVLHMDAGDGESCYSDNSERQLYVFQQLQHHFTAALRRLRLPENGPLRIADHGCAHGPNSVAHLRSFIENIPAATERPVHAFFNDLPCNDFNDLLRRAVAEIADGHRRKVYVAAAPGSFYREVFPPASIHVAYSVMALHYLSQIKVPPEVTRPGSMAYNAGKVWINGSKTATAEAYAEQARRDLRTFFTCRAHEMVKGGVLMLLLMGRPDGSPPHSQIFAGGEFCGQDFEQAWDQLIAKGVLKSEQKDSFNLPWYFPTAEELKSAAEETGGFETILATVCEDVASKTREDFEDYVADAANYGRMKSRYVKSFAGSLVEAHIGKRYSDELFERFSEHAAVLLAANPPARTTVCAVATFYRRGSPSDTA